MPLPIDHVQRNAYILQEVGAGRADVVWVPLTVKGAAHEITLQVTADAVKVDGVRFGAGARLAQQVADLLGAFLVTPKIMDLMFDARAVTLPPFPHYDPTRMEDTSWFVEHSAKIDRALAAAGGLPQGGIVQTVGKGFCLSNQATSQRGVNYGWNMPKGSTLAGVPLYPSVTLSSLVIQQPGTAHGLSQDDYASTLLMAAPDCGVDGAARKLQDVLTDPELSKLLSHEGPLRQLRQPGVAPLSPSAKAIEAAARAPGIATLAGAIIGGAISMNPAGAVAGAAVGSAIDARRRA